MKISNLFRKKKLRYDIDDSFLKWSECMDLGFKHWFIRKSKDFLKNKKNGEYFAKGKQMHYKAIKKDGEIRYYSRLRKGKAKKWVRGNEIVYTPKNWRNPFEP